MTIDRVTALMVSRTYVTPLSGSVVTWASSGRAHHVTQDHPVYIPRDLDCSVCAARMGLSSQEMRSSLMHLTVRVVTERVESGGRDRAVDPVSDVRPDVGLICDVSSACLGAKHLYERFSERSGGLGRQRNRERLAPIVIEEASHEGQCFDHRVVDGLVGGIAHGPTVEGSGALICQVRDVPGATCTSDLLFRRFLCGHLDPFRTVRDLGLVSLGCPGGSATSEGCSSVWLPAWLPAVRGVRGQPVPDLFAGTIGQHDQDRLGEAERLRHGYPQHAVAHDHGTGGVAQEGTVGLAPGAH